MEVSELMGIINTVEHDHRLVVEKLQALNEIQRKQKEFANSLALALQLGNQIPRAVLLDVLGYGWELWDLLDRHAHDETRGVHNCFSRFLASVPGMYAIVAVTIASLY